MKNFVKLMMLVAIVIGFSQCGSKKDFKNPNLSIEERVDALMSQMTMEEKIGQLKHGDYVKDSDPNFGFFGFLNSGLAAREGAEEYNKKQKEFLSHNRLGIPALKCGEALFAYIGNGSTSFPQSLALASSFDPDVVAKMADALGDEIHARGVRQIYAPNINIARDSRWGRTSECYGEDPYLMAKMGVAYCKEMRKKGILTCPKHWAANMGMDGKFGAQVHFTERYLRDIYFPAFKACIQESGANLIMMAYNTIDGVPCHANKWMMTDVLKGEWGFDGFVVSDGGSEQITFEAMGVAKTKMDLFVRSFNAGCDISDFNNNIEEAFQKGLITKDRIDDACRRVLRQKFKTGVFENPYVDPEKAAKINDSPEHRQLALELGGKCMVLLKNDNNVLPLSKNVKSVALVGPFGDYLLVTCYGGWGQKRVTLKDGIEKLLPGVKINYEKGAEPSYCAYPAIHPENFVGGLKGEYFDNVNLEGKPKYVRTDSKIDFDWKDSSPEGLPNDNFSIRWTGKLKSPVSGKYNIGATVDDGVRLYINGEKILDMWGGGNRRISEAPYNFEKNKVYDIKMEYFDNGFTASAQLGWNVEPLLDIQKAVNAVKNSDVAIVAVGMRDEENLDRASLELNEEQEVLIKEIAKTGKPFVVVLQSGNVIAMHNWIDKAPAVMEAWYPGEEGGNVIAQTLFGDNNPGGKLPVTFPQTTGQVPINYNHFPYKSSDVYVGIGNEPLFPFGHGLSYTTFEYSNGKISKDKIKTDESITVSVDVKNTGNCDGDEVVQLYIHPLVSSVCQPVMRLKGFSRISLKKGETKNVSLTLTPEDLKIWDINMKFVVEPGIYNIMIGSSSADIRNKVQLEVLND
jgi:beta-glucosidase